MTTLFIVSMFAILLMLSWKAFEIKVRKIHFISNLFSKADSGLHRGMDEAWLRYKRYKKIAYIFVFEFLPSYFYEQIVKLKDYIAKKYYLAGDEFRGRRVLRNSGSVSFFLQELSDDKERKNV